MHAFVEDTCPDASVHGLRSHFASSTVCGIELVSFVDLDCVLEGVLAAVLAQNERAGIV